MRKVALTLAAAGLLSAGTAVWLDADRAQPQLHWARASFGPVSHAAAVQRADETVAGGRARLAAAPGEWLPQEVLALGLIERFRLTGNEADLTEAGRLLEAGLAAAPEPAGPSLSAAQHALMLHDLGTAQAALARFERTAVKLPDEQAAAWALAGDIAFQRGNIGDAEQLYRQAHAFRQDFGSAARLANVALWRGEPAQAIALAEGALQDVRLTPQDRARAALLLADFSYAAGRLDDASMWVDRAEQAFTGFWLVEAYAAQQLAANGRIDAAIAALEDLAERTSEPEVIDTLAGLLRHAGRSEEASRWTRAATRLWDEKLESARDAYRLHAAEHHLDFGDPAIALALAQEEVAKRPFGEAIEVLASAYLANDRPQKALAWLERAERQGYRAVSLDMARGEVLEALGQPRQARQYYQRAAALNPDAAGDMRKLLRFGHY